LGLYQIIRRQTIFIIIYLKPLRIARLKPLGIQSGFAGKNKISLWIKNTNSDGGTQGISTVPYKLN
jgi:hypothetical protein